MRSDLIKISLGITFDCSYLWPEVHFIKVIASQAELFGNFSLGKPIELDWGVEEGWWNFILKTNSPKILDALKSSLYEIQFRKPIRVLFKFNWTWWEQLICVLIHKNLYLKKTFSENTHTYEISNSPFWHLIVVTSRTAFKLYHWCIQLYKIIQYYKVYIYLNNIILVVNVPINPAFTLQYTKISNLKKSNKTNEIISTFS